MTQGHWIDPERVFDSVVAMSDDAIYVANPKSERALEIRAALESGQPPSVAVKDDPTTILIGSITKVSYDRNDDEVDIDYRAGKSAESKNVSFSSREERDDFAATLTERLPGFQSRTVEWSRFRAALGPSASLGFLGFMTWVLFEMATALADGAEAEASGRRAGLKAAVVWVVDFVGPIGVLIVGGLLMALATLALVHRVKTPPIMTTLKPAK